MTKEQQSKQVKPQENFYENSLFAITPVCHGGLGEKSPLQIELPTGPKLSEWLVQMDQHFNEDLAQKTLDRL